MRTMDAFRMETISAIRQMENNVFNYLISLSQHINMFYRFLVFTLEMNELSNYRELNV